MGGSSLCVEVLRLTFGKFPGYPELHVLDSTDPAQVKAVEKKLDLKKTLCIVSSKSGSTLEPNIFKQYFYERIRRKVGEKEVGSQFIAVTDPGSKMEQVAKDGHFRHIFPGVPSIGGRYSALSHFGTVPGAIMGLDLSKFLKTTQKMVKACGPTTAPEKNPGVILGTILGVAANQGRDKITIFTSPGISDLGAWLEQLIAESTGKVGKGIIPVEASPISAPGSNSSSPNPPVRSARASSPSIAKKSASPRSTATIASSPICASPRKTTARWMPPSPLSKKPGIPSSA